MDEKEEITLEKHTTRSWFKSSLLGFFIGLAVIVPGISGSTVAIIFKLYDKLLYAVSKIFKKFAICFMFLLPIIIGGIVGFALGFIGIQQLLAIAPFAVIGLFAGLMIGAFPAVKDEVKGSEKNPLRITLLILGVLIPIALGVCSALFQKSSGGTADSKFATIEWWEYLLFIVIGYLVAITQVVPGLSATALLMALGYFSPLMDSFHMTYWKGNPAIFGIYVALGIGFLLGLYSFSKFLTYLFKKARTTTYYMIVGLSLGSVISMFFNPDTYEIYQKWSRGEGNMKIDLPIGMVLFAIGMVLAYLFVLYERKKQVQENQKIEAEK